jgi:hypothetical protein
MCQVGKVIFISLLIFIRLIFISLMIFIRLPVTYLDHSCCRHCSKS